MFSTYGFSVNTEKNLRFAWTWKVFVFPIFERTEIRTLRFRPRVARWLHAILINVDFIPWLLAHSFISILDEALSILYDEIFPKFCVNKRTTLFLRNATILNVNFIVKLRVNELRNLLQRPHQFFLSSGGKDNQTRSIYILGIIGSSCSPISSQKFFIDLESPMYFRFCAIARSES